MCFIDTSVKIKTNNLFYNNLYLNQLDGVDFIDYEPTNSYIHLFSVIISLVIYFIILFSVIFYLIDGRK